MLRSIAARTALVTCIVAALSVLVTAAVGIPLTATQANRAARQRLADDTKLTAELMRPRFATTRNPADEANVAKRLAEQGIEVYLIRLGQPDRAGLPPGLVKLIAAGQNVDVR